MMNPSLHQDSSAPMKLAHLKTLAISALLLVSWPSHAKETVSETEAVIAKHVAAENPRAMALLQETVDINSGTMNFAGVL